MSRTFLRKFQIYISREINNHDTYFALAFIYNVCETQLQVSISSIFPCLFICLSSPWWHIHLSPSYDVLDYTNHIFSESLSSGDDNYWDEDLQKDKYKDKDTQTQTKTNKKWFQDPMYAIFIHIRGFKDLKYYIGCLLVMT